MSKNETENETVNSRLDRRQWLKTSATALGVTLLPSPLVVAQPEPASSGAKPAEAKSGDRFFTPQQHELIEELTETIIPADSNSGGAKAAKVADYIEQVVRESVDDAQKALWKEGLRLIDVMSQHHSGKLFVSSSTEERIAVLTVLSENEAMTELTEVRFYRELKRLTVRGYYTSKIGIHDELRYKGNTLLLEYVGCDDQ